MELNQNTDKGVAASRYADLETKRDHFLRRARDSAMVTLPTLIPPEGHSEHTVYPTPYQSVGARGVNNLAAKLMLAMFPTNDSFFRMTVAQDIVAEMKAVGEAVKLANIEKQLAEMERIINRDFAQDSTRIVLFEALKHLIVAGNVLLYLPPKDGNMKLYRLDRYVCHRDAMGEVLELILKDTLSESNLPDNIKAVLADSMDDLEPERNKSVEKDIDVYTYIKRVGNSFEVFQEVKGREIPRSRGKYPVAKSPWLALRFVRIDSESYGRGHVEEYLGDLISLEALSKALTEGAQAAAKILFMVRPNGTTRKQELEKPNGSVVTGDANDVSVLQLEKYADFRVAKDHIQTLHERLGHAFLLQSGVTRQAERVTAYEVQKQTEELETQLGGVYSLLSRELQLPIVKLRIQRLQRQKKLPQLPDDSIDPVITTGVEALGRGNDLSKLNMLIQQLQPLGPEVITQYINITDYISRVANSVGIDTEGLVKTQEEVQQGMEQEQMMGMAQQAVPHLTKGLMDQNNGSSETSE